MAVYQQSWNIPPTKFGTTKNGWSNYSGAYAPLMYWVTNGIFYLSGLIKGGTTTSGTVIVQLPYAPAYERIHACQNGADGTLIRVDTKPDGTVSLQQAASASWLSLEGICFPIGG